MRFGEKLSFQYEESQSNSSHVGKKLKVQRCNRSVLLAIGTLAVLSIAVSLGVGIHFWKKSNTASNLSSYDPSAPTTVKPLCPWSKNSAPILLISLDGFWAGYLEQNVTPTLQKLADQGISAPYMRSVFPTVTFPNHYSIVTGLYPESHGIVGNKMFDPSIGKMFTLYGSTKSDPAWWSGEPIWITAKKQGKRSATYFWPGSDVNISGCYPTKWKKYDGSIPYKKRVDTVIKWLLQSEDTRYDFISLYFNNPDKKGHTFGPQSPVVTEVLQDMDQLVSYLLNELKKNNIDNCVNIIIVADHGMSEVGEDNGIHLSKYIKTNKLLIYDGAFGSINTKFYVTRRMVKKNEHVMPVKDVVEALECRDQYLKVFTRETAPKRFHYLNNPRSGDVLLDVRNHWLVFRNKGYSIQGQHGYDNLFKSMQALFIAYGPAFKSTQIEPFENIELYNLMAAILNIKPAPNNGTWGKLHNILRNPPSLAKQMTKWTYRECVPENKWPKNFAASLNCSCSKETINLVSRITSPDNSSSQEIEMLHAPLGLPCYRTSGTDECVLHKQSFISAFSHQKYIISWTAFRLSANSSWNKKVPKIISLPAEEKICIVPDERMPFHNFTLCNYLENKSLSITTGYMFDPRFINESEAYLASNAVPMYTGFKNGIWNYLWRLLKMYADESTIIVTMGPIFDWNNDGLHEEYSNKTRYVDADQAIPLPTHYYAVLYRCHYLPDELQKCKRKENLDILSFILPHLNTVSNCQNFKEYLADNVARIRDIELLTGLKFFENLPPLESIEMRTFLPTKLWEIGNVESWLQKPCPSQTLQCPSSRPPLLLISLDGFRADYMLRNVTPVIRKLRKCGIQTPYMTAMYPSKTFPNHYSIVTGLYPESHGIVGNTMYDEKIGKIFRLSSKTKMDPAWWGGEPIWITAKRQNRTTATYFWPGSDVNITGVHPDIWKYFDQKVGFMEQVKTVLDWLSLPLEQRPDFITLYFSQPDYLGHKKGPYDVKLNKALQMVDELLNQLMEGLQERHLQDCVNILVVADHGMEEVSCAQVISVKDFVNLTTLMFDGSVGRIYTSFEELSNGTVVRILKDNYLEELVEELTCKNPHMHVFKKETIPKRFHFANNPRIGNLLLEIDLKWLVTKDKIKYCSGGAHGYDNAKKSMHALFVAFGPSFKRMSVEPFENIELYNLMADLLDILPAENNGTSGRLSHFLKHSSPPPNITANIEHYNCTLIKANHTTATNDTTCHCSHTLFFNFTIQNQSELDHAPFGVPRLEKNQTLCIVNRSSYLAGYSHHYHMPLWMSYTLNNQVNKTAVGKSYKCLVKDVDATADCPNYEDHQRNIIGGYLRVPQKVSLIGNLTKSTVLLQSNFVPMYRTFRDGIWRETEILIQEYANKYGHVNVLSGPLFDYNFDGLADSINTISQFLNNGTIPIPTHFFIVLTKCHSAMRPSLCGPKIDVLTFILPHIQRVPNCLKVLDYLKDNTARVRDVELLSGFRLFVDITVQQSLILRTILPTQLWLTDRITAWTDLPCPAQNMSTLCPSDYHPVVIVSLDGFRADYLSRNLTPVLQKLAKCGVHVPNMRSVFPTKTFPNHYTVVTGLYPESHGIVDNSMSDVDKKKRFYIGNRDRFWWGGEPIWITAQNQGKLAASYFWVGSDVKGMKPNISRTYNKMKLGEERVDEVLAWLNYSHDKRPDFVTLYFEEPDQTGHRNGPFSIKIGTALKQTDALIGHLMDGLYQQNLHYCVNLIVVSDHGMSPTSCQRQILVSDHINKNALRNMYVYDGAFGRIANNYKYNSRDTILPVKNQISNQEILANLSCRSPHVKVFEKHLFPKRHHYANNKHIDDIILEVQDQWLVSRRFSYRCYKGNHGYDSRYRSMQSLFLAHGPGFKQSLVAEPFENIELYNMMADLLNITAAPNNGTRGRLNHFLQNPKALPPQLPKKTFVDPRLLTTSKNYTKFMNVEDCHGRCAITQNEIDELHRLLQVNVVATGVNTSLPWGLPRFEQDTNLTLLKHSTHVTAYSSEMKMPTFVAFSLLPRHNKQGLKKNKSDPGCIMADPRIPVRDQFTCSSSFNSSQGFVMSPLFPTDFTTDSNYLLTFLSSNYVPVNVEFYEDVWKSVLQLLKDKQLSSGWINIVTGPIFDYNVDGLADSIEVINKYCRTTPPVPTHIFLIVTSCKLKSPFTCPNMSAAAYILPNIKKIPNCQKPFEHIKDNVARVRDVELLTNMEFYAELPFEKAVVLRTSIADH